MWVMVGAILIARASSLLELACHFTAHLCVLALLLMIFSLWNGHWKIFLVNLAPAVYLLVLWSPWSLWFDQPQAEGTHHLKIVAWNVLCVNQNTDEIRRVIQSHPADLLVLIEVRPNLMEQVPEILERYPQRLMYPSWGGNGIAVLTNREDIELERVDFEGRIMPSIVATVRDDQGAEQVKIVGMHTWSPVPPSRAVPRDFQLHTLNDWARLQSVPLAVVGDLNITPWAPAFADLMRSGFIDSRASGFGNAASWPSWLGPLGIPIDHALTYGDCRFVHRQLGPMVVGSDHRPLVLELTW